MVYKKAKHQISEMIDDGRNPEVEETAEVEAVQDFAYSGGKGNWGKILTTMVVIVIILVGGWYLLGRFTSLNVPGMGDNSFKSTDWQAVFLSNGQVYFGKIKNTTKDNIILSNIYYLQVVDKPLQRTQEGEEVPGQAQTQQELTLIKLGNELHGPIDEMVINRDHVLLTERLKEDSRVIQAINNYLDQQAQQ